MTLAAAPAGCDRGEQGSFELHFRNLASARRFQRRDLAAPARRVEREDDAHHLPLGGAAARHEPDLGRPYVELARRHCLVLARVSEVVEAFVEFVRGERLAGPEHEGAGVDLRGDTVVQAGEPGVDFDGDTAIQQVQGEAKDQAQDEQWPEQHGRDHPGPAAATGAAGGGHGAEGAPPWPRVKSGAANVCRPRWAGTGTVGHEGRTEPVHVPGQAQHAFLRVATGERQVLGVRELTAQRLVAALGGADHLGVQAADFVRHAALRRLDRSVERRIERRHGRQQRGHPFVERVLEIVQGLLDRRRQLCLSHWFSACSSCACSDCSSSDVRARNRSDAESRIVPVARCTISGIGVSWNA